MLIQMPALHAPHHIIHLLARRLVQRRAHRAITRHGISGLSRQALQPSDGQTPRILRQLAGTLSDRHIVRLRRRNRQRDARRHHIPIGRSAGLPRTSRWHAQQHRMQRPTHRAAHQILRVGASERLHGLVRIPDQHQPHADRRQRLEEPQPSQRGVVEVIHHQHRRHGLRLQPHLPVPHAVEYRSRLNQQTRGIQTVFPRIRAFDGLHILAPQGERQPPLHPDTVGVPPGTAQSRQILVFMGERCAQLVDAGQHIPQLVNE